MSCEKPIGGNEQWQGDHTRSMPPRHADPREMDTGTPLVPQPLEKNGTTPEALKNPSWLRRMFRGELGARHPRVILNALARACDLPSSGFYGISDQIGYALDATFQGIGAYKDPRVLEELKQFRAATTPTNCTEMQMRKEGVAAYVRRWLSGDPSLEQVAPNFAMIWNRWVQSDDLVGVDKIHRNALEKARVEIDVYQGLTPREQDDLEFPWLVRRSPGVRFADAIQRLRDDGVMTTCTALVRTWGPRAMFILAWLLLIIAPFYYQPNKPHLFTIKDRSGESVTVECWLNEWATGVSVYVRTSDGDLEPIDEIHYFDSSDAANDEEAFLELANAATSIRELGFLPTPPHPLRDAAIAACEQLAPPPL